MFNFCELLQTTHSAFKCRPLQMRPVKSNLRSWNVCFCQFLLADTQLFAGKRHISTFEVSRLNKRNKCIFFTFNLHRKFFWSTIKFTRLHYVTEKSAKSAARWKKNFFVYLFHWYSWGNLLKMRKNKNVFHNIFL